jgi:putative hydrolase of HD superfamily
MDIVGKSKKLLRSGWINEKIKDPESVAEHSFRVSVLAMVISDSLGLDKEKLIKMALIHDLGEVITGDIVWSSGNIIDIKKRTEKEKMEKLGLERIFKILENSDEYKKIFEEMIERSSEEAKIFWQIDKLEMAMQALEYERDEYKNLEKFFVNADLQIETPLLRKIFDEILKRRKKGVLSNRPSQAASTPSKNPQT